MDKQENIDFNNLDMTKFTDLEKEIIETIKNIIENDDYEQYPIENVSLKVKTLLKKIYTDKNVVFEVFKELIDLYKKYDIKLAREERITTFEKIRDNFNSIVRFINKVTKDYDKLAEINMYINDIESYYLPSAIELASSNYFDDTSLDDELDKKIQEYRDIIKSHKDEMAMYFQDNMEEEIDIRENTDNLVLCLSDDINLSGDNYKTGFSTTVSDLESKSSRELKGLSGGAGLEKIRKSTETGGEADFTDYLKNKLKMQCHFVPYRYRSGYDTRVGLIKFEPSPAVKEHLEARYNLSKQSACYGIFMIIVAGANHKQYADFENYIMKNYVEIEKIAALFASDNPNYEELDSIVDKMLSIKKEKLNSINDSKKTI